MLNVFNTDDDDDDDDRGDDFTPTGPDAKAGGESSSSKDKGLDDAGTKDTELKAEKGDPDRDDDDDDEGDKKPDHMIPKSR